MSFPLSSPISFEWGLVGFKGFQICTTCVANVLSYAPVQSIDQLFIVKIGAGQKVSGSISQRAALCVAQQVFALDGRRKACELNFSGPFLDQYIIADMGTICRGASEGVAWQGCIRTGACVGS